jgi:hypothetical protein
MISLRDLEFLEVSILSHSQASAWELQNKKLCFYTIFRWQKLQNDAPYTLPLRTN